MSRMTKETGAPLMRVKLARGEAVRHLVHQEFVALVGDAVARAGLPVAQGNGAKAKFRITSGPPLAAGHLSRCEYMDFELTAPVAAQVFGGRLQETLPAGVDVLWQRRLPARSPHLRAAVRGVYYVVAADVSGAAAVRFEQARTWPFKRVREKRDQNFDLKRSVSRLRISPGRVEIGIGMRADGTPKVAEILTSVFDLHPERVAQLPTERVAVDLSPLRPLGARDME